MSPNKPFAAVTGGSSGIGYHLAVQFVRHGFDVLIAGDDSGRVSDATRKLAISATALPA